MSSFSQRIWAGYMAIVLTLCLLFRCNLVPAWGQWYSDHLPLRWQTERLLQGHVALSDQPEYMSWDMAWANGSVQQVWGLAVPLWRLPFEALARLCGKPGFPDRLAFALAFALTAYGLIRFNVAFAARIGISVFPWGWLGIIPVILFPPFVGLCVSRFLAYEEVVAFGFLAALLLLIWAVRLSWRPRSIGFLALALAAGLMGFIRPTFAAYGAASLLVASLGVWNSRSGDGLVVRRNVVRLLCSGAALFCLGLGLLFWSNASRFGSGLEFGHSLNLNALDSMRYASRFDYPFHSEPICSAARELFGLLFFARPVAEADTSGANLFLGQSAKFRWREIYFSTYDLSYAVVLAAVWVWLGWRVFKRMKVSRAGSPRIVPGMDGVEIMALWSLAAFVPLVVFYLRAPFASSRYLLDFGPAVAVALWTATWQAFRWMRARYPNKAWILWALSASVFGWWGCEMGFLKVMNDPAQPLRTATWNQLAPRLAVGNGKNSDTKLPSSYTGGFNFRNTGIPFNGAGWSSNGATRSCVALFLRDPECVVLDVAPAEDSAREEDYECIRAKIGLEFLTRESITPTIEGMRIVFRSPQRQRYQKGIQVAFLGMVPVKELSDGYSKLRLLKVSWHREAGQVAASETEGAMWNSPLPE